MTDPAATSVLFSPSDVDGMRRYFREKPKGLTPKLMRAKEAIARFVQEGDYLAVGGFGTNRIPSALLHEVVRQRRKKLRFSGHTSTHDMQILVGGG